MLLAALMCSVSATQAAPDIKQTLLASRMPVPVPKAPQLSAAAVHAIFRVDKSENRNQVYYGARVDAACRPLGASPVYAYWLMRERGPNVTEALLGHEQPAYGIHSQRVLTRSSHGGSVRLQLRAWPDRPLDLELFRAANSCAARARLDIQHQPAILQSIYIDIGFLFSVNHALVRGTRVADGRSVQEKLRR
jgi:hypothetical protein